MLWKRTSLRMTAQTQGKLLLSKAHAQKLWIQLYIFYIYKNDSLTLRGSFDIRREGSAAVTSDGQQRWKHYFVVGTDWAHMFL